MTEFNYRQRCITKEYFEGYENINWGQNKNKKITIKEARKKALEIGKKAEDERNNWPEGQILLEDTHEKNLLTSEDMEDIKKLNEQGIPVFYE